MNSLNVDIFFLQEKKIADIFMSFSPIIQVYKICHIHEENKNIQIKK